MLSVSHFPAALLTTTPSAPLPAAARGGQRPLGRLSGSPPTASGPPPALPPARSAPSAASIPPSPSLLLLLPSLPPSFLRPCPAARGSERSGDAAAPPPAPEVSGEARLGSCCCCCCRHQHCCRHPLAHHRGAAPRPSPGIFWGLFLASPGSLSLCVCVGTGGAASAAAAPCAGAAQRGLGAPGRPRAGRALP